MVVKPDDDTNIVRRNQEIALAMSIHLENAKSYEERSTEISESHFFDTRRWKGDELANAVGVPAKTHIYMAEKLGKLPEEFKEIRNDKGYTLSMVNEARKYFGW